MSKSKPAKDYEQINLRPHPTTARRFRKWVKLAGSKAAAFDLVVAMAEGKEPPPRPKKTGRPKA